MAADMIGPVVAKLSAIGIPEMDYSTFRTEKVLLSSGSRSFFVKGDMYVSILGKTEKKKVVLKTISERYTRNASKLQKEKLIQYFEREAGIWRHSRSHPNILQLYGYMRIPGQTLPSLVSPFYELGNARSFVEDPLNRGLSAMKRMQLTRDVAQGLNFLHTQSPVVVHRDLRGSNVLVRATTSGITGILIDFGSAKLSDQNVFPVMNSTQPNDDSWSPPEYILEPNKYTDGTTCGDVWSLACTCYEIFSARDPYPRNCDLEDVHEIKLLPDRKSVDISNCLWELLARCWSHVPKSRPSAYDVVIDLEGIIYST